MKYLIVIDHDLEMAVLFDEILTHSEVAKSFPKLYQQESVTRTELPMGIAFQ